jgi:outer membrane protein TolC
MAISQEVLTIEEAIRIGLEKSYSIQIAQNNVEIASNNNTLGNAGYLPSLALNVNQSNNFQDRYQENSDETTSSISGYPTYSLSSAVQLNWTLFDGFSMFIQKEKLELFQAQSELLFLIEVENTIADIVYTYYNIALNEKLFRSYNEQLALSRQRLDVAREKSKIGVGYQLQELQAEVDFRADSAQLIRQRNRVVNLKADLNQLLIREADVNFSINMEIPVPKLVSVEEVYEKIINQNEAILNARITAQISELELSEAKSSRYPEINLFSSYNFSHTGTPEGQVQIYRTLGPTVGIGASISLFNGFNANRRINNARILAENQRIKQEDLALRLKSAAFKMVNELNQAIDLVCVEEKSVSLALQNTEAAWERYRLGAISDLELRESQNKLLDAQTRLLQAQMNAQAAEIEIRTLTSEMEAFIGR